MLRYRQTMQFGIHANIEINSNTDGVHGINNHPTDGTLKFTTWSLGVKTSITPVTECKIRNLK